MLHDGREQVRVDGGPRIRDEWGPAVSFHYNILTPRVVQTWYTTRDDINDVKVDLYMMYSEDSGGTWSTPQEITLAQSGQTIPWDYHGEDWSDYQSISSAIVARRMAFQ